MNYKNNLCSIQDSISAISLLETEDDSEFLEWCSMEGSKRIFELSRQLHTFFNYKNIIIRLRFSRSKNKLNIKEITMIEKQEDDLINTFFKFTPLMDIIGADEENIAEKIRYLIRKIIDQPKNFERDLLKKIKELSKELWIKIHGLSALELQNYPRLLSAIIQISKILCSAESVFFWPFSSFYLELKQNYSRLEKEVSNLLQSSESIGFKIRKNQKKVRIVE